MTSDLAAVPALYWFWVIVQRMLVFDNRFLEQVLERIGLSQRHIGERKQRLLGKRGVGEGGGAQLRARLLGLDLAPDLAPDVERPRSRGFRSQLVVTLGELRSAEPFPLTVGKSPARASLMSASAAR